MPHIQLIRRDGNVINLDAENVAFGFTRFVASQPLPVLAVRTAVDLNQTKITINVDGILTDDDDSIPALGAAWTLDLSMGVSQSSPSSSFFGQFATLAALKTELHQVNLTFQTAGQVSAGLGEDVKIKLFNGTAPSNTVATNSQINVNISSAADTDAISDAINTALASANIRVDTAATAFTTAMTVTRTTGQQATISSDLQGSAQTVERITFTNTTLGSTGNAKVRRSKTVGRWSKQFFVTNVVGGSAAIKMTKGDKLQDLINSVTNASAGGALISPQTLAGSLIDLPDSIASFDASKFLNIESTKAVGKYIVGIRIPYESLMSASAGTPELRQFLIPAGPGTDFSAESNTATFDPMDEVNGVKSRPNPFLRQGVAIPAVVTRFDPSYEAGDSVWRYSIILEPVEVLVGI